MPQTFGTQPVSFTLVLDSIAQEGIESFTLRLDYNRSLFGDVNDDISQDELHVTIIDNEGSYYYVWKKGGFRASQITNSLKVGNFTVNFKQL